MDKCSILVYDSGIGGVNVFFALRKAFPSIPAFYASDSPNAPYGSKNKSELLEIVEKNFEEIGVSRFGAVILACNTLSTNCIDDLQSLYPSVAFFGVRPPIEPDADERSLLICTELTAKSGYVRAAARGGNLDVVPMQGLVSEIEACAPHFRRVKLDKYFANVKRDYKKIYLGCTHFCFLRSELSALFPNASLYDGIDSALDKSREFLTDFSRRAEKLPFPCGCRFIFRDQLKNEQIYNYVENSAKMLNF